MKVLVVGAGSIGKRHALNFKSLNHEVVVCDTNKDRVRKFSKENDFSYYLNYFDAINTEDFDAAVIATPSNFHIEPAIDLASHKLNIFMEKPLSISMEKVNHLSHIVEKNNLIFMMGQSYRFHEGMLCIKDLMDNNIVGDIYNVEMLGGWYLPDWHYKEDYTKEYAARSDLGGGVLLTSLSHSIDTVRWLFGEVVDFRGWKANLGNLKLDVDDYVSCSLFTDKKIIVNIIDDFLSRIPRNQIRINGSEGFIVSAFSKNEIHYWNTNTKRFLPDDKSLKPNYAYKKILEDGINYDTSLDKKSFTFNINKRYVDEINFFAEKVKERDPNFSPNLFDGIRVMEILTNEKISELSWK